MKKKTLAAIVCAALICMLPVLAMAKTLNIVCTTFAQYDWTRCILGEGMQEATLTLLLDSRVDMHSYQPSAGDIVAIAGCDLFIYVGGESDAWARDVLEMTKNPARTDIALMDCVRAAAPAHAHVHDHAHEQDEHVWLSLRNAKEMIGEITRALCALRPEHGPMYTENAQAYIAQLDALDRAYAQMVEEAAYDTLLFADRFPFAYLAQDYGLAWAAAFSGCAAESEASFETVVSLARTADELNLTAVMTIEGTETTLAETVIANTAAKNQRILRVNSMQSVTQEDIKSGMTYLDTMRENLRIFEQALH